MDDGFIQATPLKNIVTKTYSARSEEKLPVKKTETRLETPKRILRGSSSTVVSPTEKKDAKAEDKNRTTEEKKEDEMILNKPSKKRKLLSKVRPLNRIINMSYKNEFPAVLTNVWSVTKIR